MIIGYLFLQGSFMPDTKGLRKIRLSLTLIPIATIIIFQSLSIVRSTFASLPPDQNHLLVSVFAYLHLLLWSFFVVVFPFPSKKNPFEYSLPTRSISWVIAGIIVALFYLFILGPGIGSFDGHPMLSVS